MGSFTSLTDNPTAFGLRTVRAKATLLAGQIEKIGYHASTVEIYIKCRHGDHHLSLPNDAATYRSLKNVEPGYWIVVPNSLCPRCLFFEDRQDLLDFFNFGPPPPKEQISIRMVKDEQGGIRSLIGVDGRWSNDYTGVTFYGGVINTRSVGVIGDLPEAQKMVALYQGDEIVYAFKVVAVDFETDVDQPDYPIENFYIGEPVNHDTFKAIALKK